MPRSALTSNCRALPARPQTEISWLRAARKEASSRRRLAAASEAAMPRPARPASSAIESLESRRLLSASWYVANWGDNSAAGSLSAPFQSIEKAAEVAQPGDTVYVRGGTYHETIRPWSSGTRTAPITFEPYNNESVTIDGADQVAGWDGSGAPIFTTQMPWSMGSGNNQIFVDGQPMTEARWPNTSLDLSHPTFATISSASARSGYDTATIYDPAITQSSGFWDGGLIHIVQPNNDHDNTHIKQFKHQSFRNGAEKPYQLRFQPTNCSASAALLQNAVTTSSDVKPPCSGPLCSISNRATAS